MRRHLTTLGGQSGLEGSCLHIDSSVFLLQEVAALLQFTIVFSVLLLPVCSAFVLFLPHPASCFLLPAPLASGVTMASTFS